MDQIPILDTVTCVVPLPGQVLPIALFPLFSLPKNKRTFVHAKRSANILGSKPLDIELVRIKWDVIAATKMLLGEQYSLMFSDVHFVPHTDPRKTSIQCVSLVQVWHTGIDESVTTVEDLPLGKSMSERNPNVWCIFKAEEVGSSIPEAYEAIENIRKMS